jgi:tRNA threonylcarbamoyladenosine biosynthesis protein TsaE
MNVDLTDATATEALGRALGYSLIEAKRVPDAGAVLYLRGELGAGKTTCVRGLLRVLGVTGRVRSPTYTLAETYELDAVHCTHVDLYRLQTLVEVAELGLRDLVGPGNVLLVEWPEKGAGALPPADIDALLRYRGEGREAQLLGQSSLGDRWLEGLHSVLGRSGLDAR